MTEKCKFTKKYLVLNDERYFMKRGQDIVLGSCKSNYHKITTTRSPYKRLVKLVDHILFDIISPNLKSYLVLVRVNPIL
jgi:hypothetical protein